MSGWHRTRSGGFLSLVIVFGSALAVHAEWPTGNQKPRVRSDCQRVVSDREQVSVNPLAQRQVMPRQIGFEAQQQGYVSKVQGAASQNVIWVVPEEKRFELSRRSWLASWWDVFGFWD